jgi:hypothetical protein
MISLSRFAFICGRNVIILSLLYIFILGTAYHRTLDPVRFYGEIVHGAGASAFDDPAHRSDVALSHTPSTPAKVVAGDRSPFSVSAPDLGCADQKPNLILSAIDGLKWQDQIFIFMQSLELALGQEALAAQRSHACAAAPILVKIIVPEPVIHDLPGPFKALMRRYPTLEFVGMLPDMPGVPVVLRRFQGLADYLDTIPSTYDNVLACDLDVVFQRNPFSAPIKPGTELLYFAEWRGMKIGQCSVHVGWFNYCADAEGGPYIVREESSKYMALDRICAGSVYGTARAVRLYMHTMAEQLRVTKYSCNDQAVHIYIYYSSILGDKLRSAGMGQVSLVPEEEALFGTVGTTPMVTFNEWGEILNELGEVQHAVHQYKKHSIISDIVWRKYGWMAEVGIPHSIPAVGELVDDLSWKNSTKQSLQAIHYPLEGVSADDKEIIDGPEHDPEHNHDSKYLQRTSKVTAHDLSRFWLANVSADTCQNMGSLCSCKYEDCQFHYEDVDL